ncbi:MarR family winged helix-turn-helix transcriptional regulator [Mucilaginibacter sp. X5P1]|uniref:MarR family winged helix-turn-helix transcriptional regulator n=1 Tax=Mucilaginibacter sp. X5P1 TaxID=2723088 RepID=UPI001619DC7F|nr:MarR family winged helix-turn-helix transcriptional regulator [Mucilaginibacter sp. X5P1]MBB6137243.1 DNA-binding MarR family transcriptional regulator [Mucilaginibacter sp. X5P1]
MIENRPEYLIHRLVMEMDRVADKILTENFGMSYKRCRVLAVLQDGGTKTQHDLALILGHSDPAVSKMLVELSKKGYVTVRIDPAHARKRLVTLTPKGNEITTKGSVMLHEHFNGILDKAKVDSTQYAALTRKLYEALIAKN